MKPRAVDGEYKRAMSGGVEWDSGRACERRTYGPMIEPMNGPTDQWTNEWTGGPLNEPMNGPTHRHALPAAAWRPGWRT